MYVTPITVVWLCGTFQALFGMEAQKNKKYQI